MRMALPPNELTSLGAAMSCVFHVGVDKGAYTYGFDKSTIITVAFTGYSKHTAGFPKNNHLGVIDVSSVKPTSHTLADGRACTITPTLLPDGDPRFGVVRCGSRST